MKEIITGIFLAYFFSLGIDIFIEDFFNYFVISDFPRVTKYSVAFIYTFLRLLNNDLPKLK